MPAFYVVQLERITPVGRVGAHSAQPDPAPFPARWVGGSGLPIIKNGSPEATFNKLDGLAFVSFLLDLYRQKSARQCHDGYEQDQDFDAELKPTAHGRIVPRRPARWKQRLGRRSTPDKRAVNAGFPGPPLSPGVSGSV